MLWLELQDGGITFLQMFVKRGSANAPFAGWVHSLKIKGFFYPLREASRKTGRDALKERSSIMRNRIIFFVLGFVSFSLVSCDNIFTSQLGLSPSLPEVSSLIVNPSRWEYTENDNVFKRTELSVLVVYADGTARTPLDLDRVEIKLNDDITIKDQVELPVGKNSIKVSYAQKDATFTLTVWSNDESGPSSGDNPDETTSDGTSIDIDVSWKK